MTKQIHLAGGCFWGTQHFLKQIRGIISTAVGYANGNTENPTYKEVYTDLTGYAETVSVEYDPAVISLERLLELYFLHVALLFSQYLFFYFLLHFQYIILLRLFLLVYLHKFFLVLLFL